MQDLDLPADCVGVARLLELFKENHCLLIQSNLFVFEFILLCSTFGTRLSQGDELNVVHQVGVNELADA